MLNNVREEDLKALVIQEISVMHLLSGHPNCITLVGFTEEPLSIVMKAYDRSLFSLVMATPNYGKHSAELEPIRKFIQKDSRLKKGVLIKGFELLPEIALHLAWGIATGMQEMHRSGFLHRDLKSANVLLEYNPELMGQERPR